MTALPTFNGGTEPTAGQLQTLLPILARRTSDSSAVTSSTTLVNDPVLIWALSSTSVVYDFTMRILFNSNTTANFKYAFTFPAGCRMDFGHLAFQTGGSNLLSDIGSVNYTSGTGIAISGSSADCLLLINGTIAVASTTGNLQFQFAQNTSTAVNTVVKAGASGTLRQVA